MPPVDIVTTDINILIKGIKKQTKLILDTIATLQNKRVWEVTRDALEEYAERHKSEIPHLASLMTQTPRRKAK